MGLREEREPGADEPCSGKCVQVTVDGTPPECLHHHLGCRCRMYIKICPMLVRGAL